MVSQSKVSDWIIRYQHLPGLVLSLPDVQDGLAQERIEAEQTLKHLEEAEDVPAEMYLRPVQDLDQIGEAERILQAILTRREQFRE